MGKFGAFLLRLCVVESPVGERGLENPPPRTTRETVACAGPAGLRCGERA